MKKTSFLSPRRLAISLLTFVFLFGCFSNLAAATFEEDYQGFTNTYNAYRSAHGAYLSTKSQYLQYKTLTSRNDALAANKDVLIARDTVLQSYLSLLKQKNVDAIHNTVLDDNYSFIETHKQQVPQVGSLADATAWSRELEARRTSLETISYKVIASLLVQKLDNIKLRLILLEGEASTLITQLKSQGKEVTTLERWLLDAKTKRTLTEQKLEDALTSVQMITAIEGESSQSFIDFKQDIFEAQQYAKETLDYITELAEAIKYGNY